MSLLLTDITRYLNLSKGIQHPLAREIILACFSYRIVPLVFLRASHYFYKFKYLKWMSYFFYAINLVIFRIEIPPRVKIGGGFFMPHPQNIVCGAAIIGECCTIYQGVTLGAKRLDFDFKDGLRPTVMSGVVIGTNSVIIGSVIINENAKISPNSTVMCDVPAGEIFFNNHINGA